MAALSASQMENIRDKAENNIPMDVITPEKQQAYDNYQNQYKDKITMKAEAGEGLLRTNAWKEGIYQQALGNKVAPPPDVMGQFNQQFASQQQQYDPSAIMQRQQSGNSSQMAALYQPAQQALRSLPC